MTEYLPLVDSGGYVIGKATRKACHQDPSLLHPVVHLHVLDSSGNLLLQKRSVQKDLFPGFWDTAVGGHLSFGESPEEALARETAEELGIESTGTIFLYSYINATKVETEYVYTYLIQVAQDLQLKPDPEEIDEIRFWSSTEIEVTMGEGIFTPNFEEEYKKLREHGILGK